jgi:hypothetical protein
MGTTTFTGPIQAGDVLDTTGSTVGSLKNVGTVLTSQSVVVNQATNGSTAGLYTTTIVIPANSQIVSIKLYVTTAWTGAAKTFNIGTSATATELAVAATTTNTGVAIGVVEVLPGTDATRTAAWIDVGASDVQIFMLSTNTGSGVGVLTVNYIQASNLTV